MNSAFIQCALEIVLYDYPDYFYWLAISPAMGDLSLALLVLADMPLPLLLPLPLPLPRPRPVLAILLCSGELGGEGKLGGEGRLTCCTSGRGKLPSPSISDSPLESKSLSIASTSSRFSRAISLAYVGVRVDHSCAKPPTCSQVYSRYFLVNLNVAAYRKLT